MRRRCCMENSFRALPSSIPVFEASTPCPFYGPPEKKFVQGLDDSVFLSSRTRAGVAVARNADGVIPKADRKAAVR